MIENLKCRFCGKPISVEVDDSYKAHGDVFKLMKMAACNPCHDLRADKRTLEFRITALCNHLVRCEGRNRENQVNSNRALMIDLTRKYSQVVARWYQAKQALWEETFPEDLLSHPEDIRAIVGNYWRMVRKENAQPDLVL